jgi:hypothetical protein
LKRQFRNPCPTCGSFARIPAPGGKLACAHCGAVLKSESRPGRPTPNDTILKVGMKALIRGVEYHAVGRLRYSEQVAGEVSHWDEWVLLGKGTEALYLQYDEGEWTLYEPFTPDPLPLVTDIAVATPVKLGPDEWAHIKETGFCVVSGRQGHIPWPVEPNERLMYVDLRAGDTRYSMERYSDNTEEWFRGKQVDEGEVYTYFGLYGAAEQSRKRDETLRGRRLFGVSCLVAAIIALIGWGLSSSPGRVVAKGETTLGAIRDGAVFGPHHLADAGRVHRLRLSTNVQSSSAWVQAVLEDQTVGELFDTDGEFWDESGSDDEGPWHEYNSESQTDFVLSKPSDLSVRLIGSPDIAASGAPVSYVIEEGVLYPSYLGTFGLLALLAGLIFLIAGASENTRRAWAKANKGNSDGD